LELERVETTIYYNTTKAEMSVGLCGRCETHHIKSSINTSASQSCLPSSEWCEGTINEGE